MRVFISTKYNGEAGPSYGISNVKKYPFKDQTTLISVEPVFKY